MSLTERSTELDPITLEVLRNKFDDITEEMEDALIRSAHSMIVREAKDAATAIFDATAQQIAQATGNPMHLGMIIPAVETFVRAFPTMADGDVYLLNDPFSGGTHLPDFVLSVPVIVDGEVIALVTAIAHAQDIGGRSPGGFPADATEVFQEGLRVRPIKLYDAGLVNQTLLDIIAANVRVPDTVIGDLYAQLAACHVGRERMIELVARYGKRTVLAAMARTLDDAELLTRATIETIPDGTYSFSDYLDHDGIDLEHRVMLRATVTVHGSDLIVDLTGSSPQVRGPINCVPASSLAAIYYVVKAIGGPDVPNNAGCYRPITTVLPLGSVVNAVMPAAVSSRGVVCCRIVDCVLGALAAAVPERVIAASSGLPIAFHMGGLDPATGRTYVAPEVGGGGMGARATKDGLEAISTDVVNSRNVPIEVIEIDIPARINYYRLRNDSGGPGRFRGGLGLEKEYEVLRGEMRVSLRTERHVTAPYGLYGGGPGAQTEYQVVLADGSVVDVPSKAELVLRTGDHIRFGSAGGGGFGDPLVREPAAVLRDVLDGKVTTSSAANSYGVVTDGDAVDESATEELRSRFAAERGPIVWTYDRGPMGRE
jgi:N-methylhydantoinase B